MAGTGASSTSSSSRPAGGNPAAAPAVVVADMYLSVKSKRAGQLTGESLTPGHLQEIIVHGWSWGMDTTSDASTGLSTGRRRLLELVVTKTIDRSSTQLANALSSNDEIKEAKLSMRKAGSDFADFLVITLASARITGQHWESDASGQVVETINFGFQSIEIVTRTQLASGLPGPASSALIENPKQ